ncbi:MAG: DUF5687 family protein [Tannerella sp.]|jgi:hypothetical protein|nr:DUF5687 family protein [Tannerella sp.]
MKKYLKLFRIEIKQFFRSQNAGEKITLTVLKVFGIIYLTVLLLSSLFLIYMAASKTGADIVRGFSRYFIYWWALDLTLRFFLQQLPTNNIKPLLTLNIRKKTIVFYTMLKTCFSFFNILYFIYLAPFSILLLILGYNGLNVLSWFLCVISIVMANNFINILLNKNNIVFYSIAALTLACGALEYYGIFRISVFSEGLFYPFYSFAGAFVIPVLLLVTLFYFSYRLIFKSFYLDEGLSAKVKEGKTENIEFLNRFGIMGAFINNDIRMIKRNKVAKYVAFSSVFFMLYGFLFLSSAGSAITSIFAGIFITGGFLITFGQKIPAWDSSCYPLMMTMNIPYRKYLEAKWWLMVIVTFISMLICTFYFFINKDLFFGVIAGGFYNIGVNSFLFMISGVYNRTPVDLNSKTKAFGNKNSMNMKNLLLMLPQLILPIGLYLIVKALLGTYPAVIAIVLIGLAGFLLRNKAFDYIVKLYKKEKYLTINAFGKIE